jgi:hypothetical protein
MCLVLHSLQSAFTAMGIFVFTKTGIILYVMKKKIRVVNGFFKSAELESTKTLTRI